MVNGNYITDNIGLIYHCANIVCPVDGFYKDDLIQEGILALHGCAEHFDKNRDVKLTTYAFPRIIGRMKDKLEQWNKKPVEQNDYLQQEEDPDRFDINFKLLNEIKKLNDRDRLILNLYYYQNLKYKDIAKILNISYQRIGQIHQKILIKLRKAIG